MRKTKKSRGRKIRWSSAELKTLKALAGKKTLKQLSRLLKRSEAAVRFKASARRISLRMR